MARILYSYFRSSAAYRVRIALNMKGLAYDYAAVNLMPGEDGQKSETYLGLNPQGRVPFLVDGDIRLGQSPAILEYLEDAYPDIALLPTDITGRGHARQLAGLVGCDIHPLNNLSVLGYLKGTLGADEEQVAAWYRHWIHAGFTAFEAMVAERAGRHCIGDTVSFADLYLIPQVWNARRFGVSLDEFPTIVRLDANAMELAPFMDAAPENQPDTPYTK